MAEKKSTTPPTNDSNALVLSNNNDVKRHATPLELPYLENIPLPVPYPSNEDIPRTKDVLLDHMCAVVNGLMPDAVALIMPAMFACPERLLFELLGNREKLIRYINKILQERISSDVRDHEEAKKVQGIGDIRHQALGDLLFQKVVEIETELSAQITGMILEMDVNNVEDLLEDPVALEAAVLSARADYMQQRHPGLLPDRIIISDQIYAYVIKQHPERAAKITGMLLEMDVMTLKHLLDDPAELDLCIKKAVETLQ